MDPRWPQDSKPHLVVTVLPAHPGIFMAGGAPAGEHADRGSGLFPMASRRSPERTFGPAGRCVAETPVIWSTEDNTGNRH
jgi:hypothetical protein